MSKTAAEVGLIVGGLALMAVPGLQAEGLIAIAGHASLLSAMFGIGVSTVLSGVGLALRPTPAPSADSATSVSFSDGVAQRRVIYGQFQTAGVLTYSSFPPGQSQATTSEFLHLVYTLAGHEITSIDAVIVDGQVYNFGTDIVWAGGANEWTIDPGLTLTPSDFYWEHMSFEFDFGSPSRLGNPFPQLGASDPSWTSAFAQQGCAKVHVILRSDSAWTALYPSGQIPNIQFLVTGKKLIDPRIITDWQGSNGYLKNQYFVDNRGVIWVQQATSGVSSVTASRPNFEGASSFPATITDNTCTWESIHGSVIADALIGKSNNPQGNLYGGRLWNDGWFNNAAIFQGVIIEAPIGFLQQQSTATGPFSGATPPASWDTTLGGTTIDNGLTWVCLGPSPHAANPSNNSLCTYDYLLDSDYGMGADPSTIDVASVISAANVCEEQALIIWNPDNTKVYENLYSCNGMFDHSSQRGNVLASLCGSMAGWVIPPGDLWHVFAGAYLSPTISLTDDDMRAPIKGDFRISKREVANSIKGSYVPAFLPTNPGGAISMTQVPGTWKPQSFPPYQANGLAGKPSYLTTEDNDQVIWQDIQFDFTTSLWTAQRLAKITLMRLRFQETLTLPCKLTAFALEAGDTFGFFHPRWGISGGVFEATQCSITFDSGGGSDAVPTIGVDIIARQVDPLIYAFTPPSSSSDFGEYSPFGITGVMSGVE